MGFEISFIPCELLRKFSEIGLRCLKLLPSCIATTWVLLIRCIYLIFDWLVEPLMWPLETLAVLVSVWSKGFFLLPLRAYSSFYRIVVLNSLDCCLAVRTVRTNDSFSFLIRSVDNMLAMLRCILWGLILVLFTCSRAALLVFLLLRLAELLP